MAILHNRVSQKELKEQLYADDRPRTTISFYKYFSIADPQAFRDDLYKAFAALEVFGRVYIAAEGVNAQVSVPSPRFREFEAYMESTPHFKGLRLNIAVSDGKSFWVLKVKVRPRIVADGIEDRDFSMENRGRYVNAEEFNRLTAEPETVVIDMRNHYEFEVGHFKDAVEIPSDTFREQLPMAAEMMKDQA